VFLFAQTIQAAWEADTAFEVFLASTRSTGIPPVFLYHASYFITIRFHT